MLKRINLGCGNIYIADKDWINCDYNPINSSVKRADLLDHLPISDNSAELVYSSHFFEHIPRSKVSYFLNECKRVLAPGGVIRLVLPDLEKLCRAYLGYRERGEHEYADIVILQMIDQCVRQVPGGELGRLYSTIRSTEPSPLDIINFIKSQNGEDLLKNDSSLTINKNNKRNLINSIIKRLQKTWIAIVISLLPKTFRFQNLSLAEVGERHHWIWDFNQIKSALEEVGFINISRYSMGSSSIADFPFFPLDVDKEGYPRKGLESMYIEARKPEI